MKRLLILIPLLLTACESEEEKKAKYMAFCTGSEFSAKQCEVLYMNFTASIEAKNEASSAAIMGGLALGMSAGRK